MVSEAVQRFRKRIPQAQVRVSIPDDFVMIAMDATLIEQVLINLLEKAYFQVIDYGKGISEEQLPHIFDGSPSSPSQSGDSRKGMGIGLSICKTIITAHSGEIHAENHENGAMFTFWLPLNEDENDES